MLNRSARFLRFVTREIIPRTHNHPMFIYTSAGLRTAEDNYYIILQWIGFYTLSILPMHCSSFASYTLASRWLQFLQNIVGRGKKVHVYVDTRNSETNMTCAKLNVPERTLASCTSVQSVQHHTHSRSLRQVPSMPFCSRILPRTDTRQYRSSNGTNSARAYSIQLSPSCSAFLPNT